MILSMQLAGILARIESRLVELHLSAYKASKLAGKPEAIRNLKRAVKDGNRQGISTATLEALAPVLQTTVSWLMTGQEEAANAAADTILDAVLTIAEATAAMALALEELGAAPEGEARVLARAVLRAIRTPPGQPESPLSDEEKRALIREAIRLFR